MSFADFQNGQAIGARNSHAQADRAIGRWQQYSDRLLGKLEDSEVAYAKAETGRLAFAHLFKTVLGELAKSDPNNPLLKKETQLRIFGAKAEETARNMGYKYDLKKAEIVGKL